MKGAAERGHRSSGGGDGEAKDSSVDAGSEDVEIAEENQVALRDNVPE